MTRHEQWIETAATQDTNANTQKTLISHFHMRWSPTSRSINFDRLSNNLFTQMVNHFEGHAEITTKDLLFKNVRRWHNERHESVFKEMLPLTFCIKVNSYEGEVDLQSFKAEFK